MNGRCDSEQESPERDGEGCVRRRYTGRVEQPKVFVTYMNREGDAGDQERQQSPSDTHLIGRRPTGKRTKCDADHKVRHTYDYQPWQPPFATRCIHMYGPTSELPGRGEHKNRCLNRARRELRYRRSGRNESVTQRVIFISPTFLRLYSSMLET